MSRKNIVIISIIILAAVIIIACLVFKDRSIPVNNKYMKIYSPDFNETEIMDKRFTCDGPNLNPTIYFEDYPKETKSFVLIVDDPDAPSKTWVHWIMWNIPIDIKGISQNSIPAQAVEGTTDFGKTGYGGPCPPSGTHRYFFKVYALDTLLDLPTTAEKPELEKAMKKHILDSAQIIGLYKREQ